MLCTSKLLRFSFSFLYRVMRRHDLTKKQNKDKYKDNEKDNDKENDKDKYIYRAPSKINPRDL